MHSSLEPTFVAVRIKSIYRQELKNLIERHNRLLEKTMQAADDTPAVATNNIIIVSNIGSHKSGNESILKLW